MEEKGYFLSNNDTPEEMKSSSVKLTRFSIYRKIHMPLITINSDLKQNCTIWKILTSFTTFLSSYYIENVYFLPTFHYSKEKEEN